MRHNASQHRDWLGYVQWTRMLPFAALAVALVLAACGGVHDNGTQEQALETAAARETARAQPPPTQPPGTPGAGETPAAGETPSSGGDDAALIEQGRQLYTSKGCIGCHSVDGSQGVGPSWQGLFGHEVTLADGSTVVADEAYLRESILNPGAKVVEGFQNIMPSFEGQLTDAELNALIAFIRSLQ